VRLSPSFSNSNASGSRTGRNTVRMPTNSISAACSIITGKTRRTISRPRHTSGVRWLSIRNTRKPRRRWRSRVCNAGFLGWAENGEANYVEAYELAQRAITLDARYPNAHFALDVVCMWTSRSERAISAFAEAINLNPSFAAAHVLLGQMHLYAGRREEAIERAGRASGSASAIRASSSGCPRWLGRIISCASTKRRLRSGDGPGSLNGNWPAGLRYVVAGLAELGRINEAQAPLAELRRLNANLALVEGNLTRLYRSREDVDHIIDGLPKAGLE
jgi:adenylate cyclase